MAQTHKGKVTDEMLDNLEGWATKYKTSWVMGINNYTLLALINEVREHRAEDKA
jgi:hypothetical protein